MHEPIQIRLEARSITTCQDLPEPLHFMGSALQHQVEVFEATRNHDIVLDVAPTGTGKTKAGLTALLHHPHRNAIYIAPTNALIEQQSQAAEAFIQASQGQLNHLVKAVSAKQVRHWSKDRVGVRPGEKLYNLLRNPATLFPEVGEGRPLLLVTNPDIFYYATFFSYSKLDRVNVASSFYTQFATIIFDEFHLYDAKQLVGLLFYLTYLHVFGFFAAGRRVILLTATPEPACEAALAVLEDHQVRIKSINGEAGSQRIPSQTPVDLEIRPLLPRDELLAQIAAEVNARLTEFPDQNGAVILDSKDQINRLKDALNQLGCGHLAGRIHGSTPPAERAESANKPIILATSTVDVGFNFERHPAPPRQNLDWLIFSARDRAAFWQRIGRVGRVLGKAQTEHPSRAIAYLSEKAWEQGLPNLDCTGGRAALKAQLEQLQCLERPFLKAYWQSEALLEAARPMFLLEGLLNNLSQAAVVPQLFETIQAVLGGRRDWQYYKERTKTLEAAKAIASAKPKELAQGPLRWVGGHLKYAIIAAFLKSESPEDYDALKNKTRNQQEFEQLFKQDAEVAEQFILFAKKLDASYAPLFQFRSSLFESLQIHDPHHLIVDLESETELDPIHLLRNYEFATNGDRIEITARAEKVYDISFHLRFFDPQKAFVVHYLNKLTAYQNCQIRRETAGLIAPTPLLSALEKEWLPGVVVSTAENQRLIISLRKQGLMSYPITVDCDDGKKSYTFFPGFSGIITAALNGVKIRLIDEEEFWLA
jgi:CRISPR-associated endonuclease/helicase Cas3